MFKRIRNIKINYKQYGDGKDLVFLHGWGQNIKMMEPLGINFKDKYRVTIIDLPGFGLSEEPDSVYTIFDYVNIVHDLLDELEVTKPILIGHSFGGRVSIVYASKYEVEKIILFGSPCVRHEVKSKKQSFYQFMKKLKIFNPFLNLLKKHIGSIDYRNATPRMRDILVKVVNQDLSENAKKIKCQALLIWGDHDEAVPVNEAEELRDLIKDSKLIILKGTHYCYLENKEKVINLMNEFI